MHYYYVTYFYRSGENNQGIGRGFISTDYPNFRYNLFTQKLMKAQKFEHLIILSVVEIEKDQSSMFLSILQEEATS